MHRWIKSNSTSEYTWNVDQTTYTMKTIYTILKLIWIYLLNHGCQHLPVYLFYAYLYLKPAENQTNLDKRLEMKQNRCNSQLILCFSVLILNHQHLFHLFVSCSRPHLNLFFKLIQAPVNYSKQIFENTISYSAAQGIIYAQKLTKKK